ncbi:MAG: isopentenyl-diphosphate Delta-isomerase [Candidatus Diapherotrites archaeon]|nr:isopentenyl-diphosphate Delta-isomerase [Candidatus Diapherotrites archaeon]
MMVQVVLVDRKDRFLGLEEKQKAHQRGVLHRAFSVFIFNSAGRMLLQKRAYSKYHSGGQWTNACCSHPRPQAGFESDVHARLESEMGFDCPLKEIFSFIYKAKVGGGLTEHEFDHVFLGTYDGPVKVDVAEGDGYQWIPVSGLRKDVKLNPKAYTPWFKIALARVLKHQSLLVSKKKK